MVTNSLLAQGFHCAGSCWEEEGGPAALIEWLGERDLALRDWFVRAEWALEEPTVVTLPPASSVHPIQDYLVAEAVEAYREESIAPPEGDYWEEYPTLFTWRGRTYIFQGTHRLAAAYRNGADSFLGWRVDLDELTS